MNRLIGTVEHVVSSNHLAHLSVTVHDEPFNLLLAESYSTQQASGKAVTLVFKESEVILAKINYPSTANSAYGLVTSIQEGDVLTHVTLDYHGNMIGSIVPTRLFNLLSISLGDKIVWMVQPSEISLLRDNHGR